MLPPPAAIGDLSVKDQALPLYSGLRTLVVDDHMLIRTTIGQMLRSFGVTEIETATNGREAWDLIVRRQEEGACFDIVFLDWNMPELDGFALLQLARGDSRLKDMAIVMLTAEQDEKRIIQTLEEGVTSYIVKPVSRETMEKNLRHITRWLEKSRSVGGKKLSDELCEELRPVMAAGLEKIFSEIFNVSILSLGELKSSPASYTFACIGRLRGNDIAITLRFLFDEDLLRPLLAQFYAPDFLKTREVYEDAAAEIVNILCNQVRSFLTSRGYQLELELPQAVRPDIEFGVDSLLNVHFSLNSDRHFMVDVSETT